MVRGRHRKKQLSRAHCEGGNGEAVGCIGLDALPIGAMGIKCLSEQVISLAGKETAGSWGVVDPEAGRIDCERGQNVFAKFEAQEISRAGEK